MSMNHHLIMVVGVGSARFLQLFFSLYLAWYFGHAALSSFVLMLSLSAAFGSLASLGGGPQILRAGAFDQPEQHIQKTLASVLLILTLSVSILPFATLLGKGAQTLSTTVWLTGTAFCFTIGSVFFAMLQSIWSYQQKYKILGLFSLFSYVSALVIAWMASLFWGKTSADQVIMLYAAVFMLVNTVVFSRVGFKAYVVRTGFLQLFQQAEVQQRVAQCLRAALFGFITLLSLYVLLRSVNLTYTAHDAAVFSLSFQFFQIGIFIPSVLGAVFVPKLVKEQQAAAAQQKKIYVWISLFWVLCSALALVPVFYIYDFTLDLKSVLTFLLLQLCVPLSSLQAMYIQQHVALGQFHRLAFNALVWGGMALMLQRLFPEQTYYSTLAILLAYTISVLLFIWRQPRKDEVKS